MILYPGVVILTQALRRLLGGAREEAADVMRYRNSMTNLYLYNTSPQRPPRAMVFPDTASAVLAGRYVVPNIFDTECRDRTLEPDNLVIAHVYINRDPKGDLKGRPHISTPSAFVSPERLAEELQFFRGLGGDYNNGLADALGQGKPVSFEMIAGNRLVFERWRLWTPKNGLELLDGPPPLSANESSAQPAPAKLRV